MKPAMQTAFVIMALFALTACGGGGGGGATPVAENPPTQAQPVAQPQPTPQPSTDPTTPQPLPAPEPIDWRYDFLDGESYVTWDGESMAMSYRRGREDLASRAPVPSYVPSTLTFTDGLAWGAIAGDRTATNGSVDIVLRVTTRTMTFDFDFPGTRLDSPNFARRLTGWQWQDSDGAGSLTRGTGSNAPISVYGVEAYDNRTGQEVEAAYWSVADDGTYGEPQPTPQPSTDPTTPQPLPAPEPIDWRYDFLDGESYVTWDGESMAMSYRRGREDLASRAPVPSYVPSTLTFTDGLAWGAIAGDRTATNGSVDIVLRVTTRTMTFDFDFPGTRLDSPNFARRLTGWQWQDSDGAGSIYGDFIGVYGVEAYDNSAGVEVEAAYWSVADR